MKQDMEQTRHLAEVIGKQWLPLIQHTIPKILVHILPYFAAGKITLNFQLFLPFKSELLLIPHSHFPVYGAVDQWFNINASHCNRPYSPVLLTTHFFNEKLFFLCFNID